MSNERQGLPFAVVIHHGVNDRDLGFPREEH